AGRTSRRAAHQVRAGDQHEDGQRARIEDASIASPPRRRGDPMTTRRHVISGLAIAAILRPRSIHAQAPPKTRHVGLLMSTTPTGAGHMVTAFGQALKELGYVEGRDVVLEYRWAEGHAHRFAELADDLVRRKMDVLVGSSQAPAIALAKATKTIPIVMVNA